MRDFTGIFAALFFGNLIISSAAQKPVCLAGKSSTSDITCSRGQWLMETEAPRYLPDHTRSLRLSNISCILPAQPVPFLPRLIRLQFVSIKTMDFQKVPVRFPLRNLTQLLDKILLEDLSLQSVNMEYLDEEDFRGFFGLQQLSLYDCSIREIRPRVFYSMVAILPESLTLLPGPSRGSGVLTKIVIGGDKALAVFTWDALLPMMGSLEVVILTHNYNLTEITYNPSKFGSISFRDLKQLAVHSTGLRTVPESVLATYSCSARNITGPFQLFFKNNTNICSSCDLVPLVNWASVYAGPYRERNLDVSCTKQEHGERVLATGSLQYWQYTIRHCLYNASQTTTLTPSGASSLVSWCIFWPFCFLGLFFCFSLH